MGVGSAGKKIYILIAFHIQSEILSYHTTFYDYIKKIERGIYKRFDLNDQSYLGPEISGAG